MYVYLREAFSPLWGFFYGWRLWTVIQTGTFAAVAIAFARFARVLWPSISESNYLIAPIHISSHYAVSLSTAQVVAIAVIDLLTVTNSRGLEYGRAVQNIFTVAKTGALLALVVLGLTLAANSAAIRANFHHLWAANPSASLAPGLIATTASGLFVAICISRTGPLFSADSWHDITFVAAEVKNPHRNLPLSLVIGSSLVILLYLLARPLANRPYRAWGYPVIPALYLIGASTVLVVLAIYCPTTTWPGFAIVIVGVPVYFLVRSLKKTAADAKSEQH